jgi:hypothetical protein
VTTGSVQLGSDAVLTGLGEGGVPDKVTVPLIVPAVDGSTGLAVTAG